MERKFAANELARCPRRNGRVDRSNVQRTGSNWSPLASGQIMQPLSGYVPAAFIIECADRGRVHRHRPSLPASFFASPAAISSCFPVFLIDPPISSPEPRLPQPPRRRLCLRFPLSIREKFEGEARLSLTIPNNQLDPFSVLYVLPKLGRED